jgi:hypothetical protein
LTKVRVVTVFGQGQLIATALPGLRSRTWVVRPSRASQQRAALGRALDKNQPACMSNH